MAIVSVTSLGRIACLLWYIFYLDSQPSSYSSVAKVAILQGPGSPQGSGFPSTYGHISGSFGVALRVTLRGFGN